MSQAENYADVEIFTGAPRVQESGGFFQPTPAAGGVLATDQARAVAEVQAALVIAASRPRNELQARSRLLQACQRKGLAESAIYKYPRSGQNVCGPSIRLAEAAARAWGNMNYGFRELSRRTGESECEAYAWDLETNTKAVRQFSVKHVRDTKKGSYALKDERDIYEFIANQAQRRVRAAILEIIPGDIIEDAVAQCEKTVKANVGDLKEVVPKMIKNLAAIGVSARAIEERLGHNLDAIQPAQVLGLGKIYTSIMDGVSEARDWFNLEAAGERKEDAGGAEEKKPEAAKPAKACAGKPDVQEKADKRGKVLGRNRKAAQDKYPFECPRPFTDGSKRIIEDGEECEHCGQREGCPALM